VDLGVRRGDSGGVAVLQDGRSDQRGKQRDDGHHHEHFDQRNARPTSSPVTAFSLEHGYTATSLIAGNRHQHAQNQGSYHHAHHQDHERLEDRGGTLDGSPGIGS